jgi:hypothetical protein
MSHPLWGPEEALSRRQRVVKRVGVAFGVALFRVMRLTREQVVQRARIFVNADRSPGPFWVEIGNKRFPGDPELLRLRAVVVSRHATSGVDSDEATLL